MSSKRANIVLSTSLPPGLYQFIKDVIGEERCKLGAVGRELWIQWATDRGYGKDKPGMRAVTCNDCGFVMYTTRKNKDPECAYCDALDIE